MKVLGIKLTHDGAVALVDGGKLIFSVEAEKLNNADRYASMPLHVVEEVLLAEGVDISTIDKVVIDGWKYGKVAGLAVAPYQEYSPTGKRSTLAKYSGPEITLLGRTFPTESFTHLAGHLAGSYAMSPFTGKCNAVIFDGGLTPRLYSNEGGDFELVKTLSPYCGLLYTIMGYYFGPYRDAAVREGKRKYYDEDLRGVGYSLPGKLMAYIAYGKTDHGLLKDLMLKESCTYKGVGEIADGQVEHELCDRAMRYCDAHKVSDEDALRTIHDMIIMTMVRELRKSINRSLPLIFTGGSALNIKWNSALRRANIASEVFVPPVPNDTGSAIGMAVLGAGISKLEWSVYSGPQIVPSDPMPGWAVTDCSPRDLVKIIADEPVVVLYGRAEIGPRALGHRSIMANPMKAENKAILNNVKGRESWRPVAPICAEGDAANYFVPGTADPYMLFDHAMTDESKALLPAVMHLDGTARLQTNSSQQCSFVAELLELMKQETGHAVVCNTSANYNGSGFFPDARSAMTWANDHAQINRVWCDGKLFTKGAK